MSAGPCRPAAADDDDQAFGQQPLGKLEILADLDVAALAGMLPGHTVPIVPSWYTDIVGEDLREIQVCLRCVLNDVTDCGVVCGGWVGGRVCIHGVLRCASLLIDA